MNPNLKQIAEKYSLSYKDVESLYDSLEEGDYATVCRIIEYTLDQVF